MERADACSRQNRRPDGVTFSFHVIANTIDPSVFNCALNLLAKADDRAALCDEPEPLGPEVTRVRLAVAFAGA